jgi:hypothetical protein
VVNDPFNDSGRIEVVSSTELAETVGRALGIPVESARLHLKTLTPTGAITFKGYGRGAAKMTPLDAARLVIAAAGSNFAKDSVEVLARFAKLGPISKRYRVYRTLEEGLADLVQMLPMEAPPPEYSHKRREWHERFGNRGRADTALQLLDPIPTSNKETAELPRYAILRWLEREGDPHVLVFGPEGQCLDRGTEIADLLDLYSGHSLFQVRIVRRKALIDIATALKEQASGVG